MWRALDAEELVRWFPLDAKVAPGEGGSISLSWGDFWSGTSAIEVGEPNRRLRTVDRRQDSTGRVVEIAVDYIIEGHGGQTVLRVVHSGFGHGAEWDAEFDSIRRGWQFELRGLRHYLTRHWGTPRRVAWALEKTSLPAEECYARLMGPAGLVREGSIAGLRPGDPYRLVGLWRHRGGAERRAGTLLGRDGDGEHLDRDLGGGRVDRPRPRIALAGAGPPGAPGERLAQREENGGCLPS